MGERSTELHRDHDISGSFYVILVEEAHIWVRYRNWDATRGEGDGAAALAARLRGSWRLRSGSRLLASAIMGAPILSVSDHFSSRSSSSSSSLLQSFLVSEVFIPAGPQLERTKLLVHGAHGTLVLNQFVCECFSCPTRPLAATKFAMSTTMEIWSYG